jgi:phenylacetate-CoA ligase
MLVLRRLALNLPSLTSLSRYRDWESSLLRATVQFLRTLNPDLIHVIAEGGFFIKAANAAGYPVLYQEPAIPKYSSDAEISVSYEKLAEALPLATELAAVSPTIASLCRELMPCPERTSVLPIITEDVSGGAIKTHRNSESVTFGFGARIERLKGPDTLINAFAIVLKSFPSARLIVAGVGEMDAEIVARVRELGIADRCQFPGPYVGAEQKKAFLQQLDVLVHPSLAEGTPNIIIEAMSCGIPIIATSVGGVPDIVSTESSVLVPKGDVNALARAMIQMARDAQLRSSMGKAARAQYERLFSPAAVVPLLLETYRRVSRRPGPKTGEAMRGSTHPWSACVVEAERPVANLAC